MNMARGSDKLPITIDPEIVSGTPVFTGTRVPIQTLFDYLADGSTLEGFLDNFPSVKRADALSILEAAGKSILVVAAGR
jgi:uncharacterized protein (DUF433 family)